MAYLNKEAYEHKQAWADRRMRENAQNDNLTEEQHNALRSLCALRHWVHCNYSDAWNIESAEYSELWECYLREGWEQILTDAGLPELHHIDLEDLPDSSDWEQILDNAEREEWEREAAERQLVSGYSLWMAEGEERREYTQAMEQLNSDVEAYLRNIDKQYGTNYAPSGITRLY